MSLATCPEFSAASLSMIGGPGWLLERRRSSWERWAGAPRPSESEEIWRYSRIDTLELERYTPLMAAPLPVRLGDLPGNLSDLLAAAGPDATLLVTANGAAGQLLRPQAQLAVEPYQKSDLGKEPMGDIFAALNWAFVLEPWTVRVAPGAELAAPLVVVHWLDLDGAALFPNLSVEVGEGASACLVEVLASPPTAKLLAVPFTELHLGRGARLGYGQVQLLGDQAWELGNQASWVGTEATFRSMTVAFGGDYARVHTASVLEGPGGDSELMAAYFGLGSQMHDLRTVQHHAAPRARSDLMFKGAVANTAHSVYSGLIRVEKGAKGTNAFQTNRNLVLSEGAQADSVPNLEIEDNDVRCSHASAVGPIDEAQLFYLESRGVPTRAAERLIALGFMDDVLERFPVAGMKPRLRSELARRLEASGFGRSGSAHRGQEGGAS
jgi:Fe-S cluster assembly protein SufD